MDGEGRQAEWDSCIEDFDFDGDDLCASYVASACCLAKVSTNDCLKNDEFVEYFNCYSERESGQECPELSEISCGAATLSGAGADDSGEGRRPAMNSVNTLAVCAASVIAALVCS